jgi:hypothetical protein
LYHCRHSHSTAPALVGQHASDCAEQNQAMLPSHYDRLALDSWLRRCVRHAWFDGAPLGDREIEARFAAFGPWRALIYWFHPALHPGRDSWRDAGTPRPG